MLELWRERQTFAKLRAQNAGGPRWSFLDGPITANNPMGVHHAWGRAYKDLYQRYKALADATPNVRFVGRLATYRYYNMDQVVGQSLALFDQLCGAKPGVEGAETRAA